MLKRCVTEDAMATEKLAEGIRGFVAGMQAVVPYSLITEFP